ncbi:hypothetical protein D9757_012960 [Collybiopsis confluens]|uniref:Uncharacterized protein n=1 Tax=Collybiopsis confluens TaxID=2823264 RepID=A0A8H5G592_9AGAR|nr:hypothetical protein D9757_012958 [Collybiopsis confluens]KAF5358578.1 hypothetical protein D9757_012960 [Collybiopsis confluens]
MNVNVIAYIGDDYPSEIPMLMSPAAMKFNETGHYDLFSVEEWKTVIPKGHGWVHMGPQGRPFAVTMYHQFHCLLSIRQAIEEAMADPASQRNAGHSSHTNHCFSYLRQGLLCKSDTTLEPTKEIILPGNKIGAAASGSGVLHKCADWVKVRNYVEENYETYLKQLPKDH